MTALSSAKKEASKLRDQLGEVNKTLESERESAQRILDQMKQEADADKKKQQEIHDTVRQILSPFSLSLSWGVFDSPQFVREMTENYERRIAGLTKALTASLEDHEMVAELVKEADAKLEGAEIMHRQNIEKIRFEMRQMEEEHTESMRQLSEEDHEQVEKMRKLCVENWHSLFPPPFTHHTSLQPGQVERRVHGPDAARNRASENHF